jgi:hypothetical protein
VAGARSSYSWAKLAGAVTTASFAVLLAGAAPKPEKLPSFQELVKSSPELMKQARLSGRGPDFAPSVTRKLWDSLPAKVRKCSDNLLRAQLTAIRATSADADKTFRNCRLGQSRTYLQGRLRAFEKAMDDNRHDLATQALGEAVAALHTFYAYSNYVELLADREEDGEAALASTARIWTEDALPEPDRLRSDYNAMVSPNDCGDGKPELDKRGPKTPAGIRRFPKWAGVSAHEAATALALQDTTAMLRYAYKLRPAYGEACGTDLILTFLPKELW